MAATLADMISAPAEIEYKGKTYAVRLPTILEMGKFQRWLEQRVFDAIDAREYRDESQRAEDRRLHNQDCGAGVYEWGGALAAKAALTPTGMAKIVELANPSCTPAEAAAVIEAHTERIAAVLTAAANDDPKAVRAALKTLGLPVNLLSSPSAARRSTKRGKKSRR